MQSPDQRTVAMDMLRPPAGHRIDQAVLTTLLARGICRLIEFSLIRIEEGVR